MKVEMYLTLFALHRLKRSDAPPHMYVCSKPFHEIPLIIETDKHSIACTQPLIPLGLPAPTGNNLSR
jgi:hypothetical protein